jgi:hypothetical protein
MVPKGWKRRFDEPIKLPGGGKLFTLKDAIAWLAKEIPQSEHGTKEVQTARNRGRRERWPDDLRPDRGDAGDQSSRRARVQSRSQDTQRGSQFERKPSKA